MRNKEGLSKDVPKSQVPVNLPPPPPLPVTSVELFPCLDLKKKRKVQEVEESEVVPLKGAKQPKNAKDRRASFTDSKEDPVRVEVRQQQRTQAPQLELNDVAIPWDASVQEFQRGYSAYVAEALEQPFLLPKDMRLSSA